MVSILGLGDSLRRQTRDSVTNKDENYSKIKKTVFLALDNDRKWAEDALEKAQNGDIYHTFDICLKKVVVDYFPNYMLRYALSDYFCTERIVATFNRKVEDKEKLVLSIKICWSPDKESVF